MCEIVEFTLLPLEVVKVENIFELRVIYIVTLFVLFSIFVLILDNQQTRGLFI